MVAQILFDQSLQDPNAGLPLWSSEPHSARELLQSHKSVLSTIMGIQHSSPDSFGRWAFPAWHAESSTSQAIVAFGVSQSMYAVLVGRLSLCLPSMPHICSSMHMIASRFIFDHVLRVCSRIAGDARLR